MREQFLGKTFWLTISGLTVAYVAAFLSLHSVVEPVLLALIGLGTLVLSAYKLEYGLYVAFAELIATSHGHLFSAGPVSIRMAIFAAVMIGWTIGLLRGRRPNLSQPILKPYALLFLAVLLGVYVGLRMNVRADVIDDANGYLYLLYILPMLTVDWTAIAKRRLLQVFAGATTFVAGLTLLILYLFTHMSEPIMRALYLFFRDARIAELTRLIGDIFRIFLQAQFFTVVFVLVLAAASFWFWRVKREQNTIALWIILMLSALIISLSRSFWIGLISGGVTLAISILIVRRPSFKEIVIKKAAGLLMVITAIALLWTVLAFPLPRPANVYGFGDLLSDRTTDASDAAISSRWNLLPEMNEVIRQSPIIGSGFGTIVAFESDDPRVRAIYPDGKWRTYSFEWGWHDAWLKMGLLGPVALIWLGLAVGSGLVRGFKKENGWLMIGFFAGLVGLYATHTFSPYLNHPIGLGFIIFLTPFLSAKTQKAPEGALVAIRDIISAKADRSPAQIPEGTSASSLRVEPVDPAGA